MQSDELQKMIKAISDWSAGRQVQLPVSLGPSAESGAGSASSEAPSMTSVNNVLSQVVRQVSAPATVQPVMTEVPLSSGNSTQAVSTPTSTGDLKEATQREELDEITKLNVQLDQLRRATTLQSDVLAENTKALSSSGSQSTAQAQSSGPSTASKIFSTVLGTGFGLGSLISGIVGLFGGSKSSSETTALQSYSLPSSIHQEAGLAPTGITAPVQYSQTGVPRPESAPASQQVTVQIQALDSRSVLDRSDDIAKAVREAMLHSHSINDVVSDL